MPYSRREIGCNHLNVSDRPGFSAYRLWQAGQSKNSISGLKGPEGTSFDSRAAQAHFASFGHRVFLALCNSMQHQEGGPVFSSREPELAFAHALHPRQRKFGERFGGTSARRRAGCVGRSCAARRGARSAAVRASCRCALCWRFGDSWLDQGRVTPARPRRRAHARSTPVEITRAIRAARPRGGGLLA
jgi:hypothetical protein